jgi:hypothetical protein
MGMFEDDVSDNANTHSGSPDEDLLGNYMYVFEYALSLALLTSCQLLPL